MAGSKNNRLQASKQARKRASTQASGRGSKTHPSPLPFFAWVHTHRERERDTYAASGLGILMNEIMAPFLGRSSSVGDGMPSKIVFFLVSEGRYSSRCVTRTREVLVQRARRSDHFEERRGLPTLSVAAHSVGFPILSLFQLDHMACVLCLIFLCWCAC